MEFCQSGNVGTLNNNAAKNGGGGRGCFPVSARLSLESGKSVAMSELQIGDKVQTGMQTMIIFLKN